MAAAEGALGRPIACVDLETTGGHAGRDRVMEAGIVLLEGGAIVEEWSTLVNPGVRIPHAIQQFTGITEAMVADAPPFAAVAQDIAARLEGRLFVAHNARFDYGFLRGEFRRLGRRLRAPVLCTVRLSRALTPGERGHNLDAVMARSVAYRRFIMLVMTGFGAFAMFLAALGVYGVLAYSVARRRREIGVRMALGARRADVLRLVAGDGARAVLPGVLLGLVGAVLLTRTMRSMLYGVQTSDPIAFSAGLAALLIVAAIAWVVPARRAARVDPITALRSE